jgi:predicted amidophosphoribosyltransferase
MGGATSRSSPAGAGSRIAGAPPGFPRCGRCPYVRTAPPHLCLTCARQACRAIGPEACQVCSQLTDATGSCPNVLCTDPDRRISRIHAIGYQSGQLKRIISIYKYRGGHAWALIFGRLVLGWLEQHPEAAPDLIIANPTYTGTGGEDAEFAHTEAVLAGAARQDPLRRWPFDLTSPHAVIKTRPTTKSADVIAAAKRGSARELRAALCVPDPARTAGRRILVYDDICTTGSQLNVVADSLLAEGKAAQVEALVLARAPWRRRR